MQNRLDIILETVSHILENRKLGGRKRKLFYPPMMDPNTGEPNPNWRGTLSRGHLGGLQMARDLDLDLANKNPNNPKLQRRLKVSHHAYWKALSGMPYKASPHVMVKNADGNLERKP